MKINEAVALAMLSHEMAFKNISVTRATRIVKLALAEIAKEVDRMDEGKILVPGFATFTIKQVEREKDGEKAAHKRVMVRIRPRKSGDSEDSREETDADDF